MLLFVVSFWSFARNVIKIPTHSRCPAKSKSPKLHLKMPPNPKSKPKTPPPYPQFKSGAQVEVNSDDPGFRGSFYTGTIIRRASTKDPNKYLVQYDTLFQDEAGTKPLREIVDLGQLRPLAPREKKRKFSFGEEVDAYHNDGWWEGAITEECEDGKFAVFFRSSKEQIEFAEEDLRLHREWFKGEWKPPLPPGEQQEEQNEPEEKGQEELQITTQVKPSEAMGLEKFEPQEVTGTTKVKPSEVMELKQSELQKVPDTTEVKLINTGSEEKFREGTLVEVSSDEDGFKGAWFPATIVEAVGKEKYLVQYQSLRTEDDTDFLSEQIDTLLIRPRPPEIVVVGRFKNLEEVDALHQDGWWVGVILQVLAYPNYVVHFRDTKEELQFPHAELRVHQDWIDGKWVMPSRALNL